MTTEEKKALLQRFRKNRTNTYALKLVLPEGLSLESAKIYLKILDDVESSMNRIEKSLYVLGRDPEVSELMSIYNIFEEIQNNIDSKFDGLTQG